IDDGMPAGAVGQSCGGGGGAGAGGGGGLPCEPALALTAGVPFTMPEGATDAQVCFGIDVPAADVKRHITAINSRIDNHTMVHHMLFMQAPSAVSPDPKPCEFTAGDWKLLYAWGPGTQAQVLPADAGFPIEAGETAHFVMQMHYNNLKALPSQTDQSGMDLCTTTAIRPHDADIMAFGGMNFTLPPNATSELACALPVPAIPGLPLTVFQAWPHMHTLGAALHGEIERGGTAEVIADVADYDFNYQIAYPLNTQLGAGDVVRTRCTWKNDTSNAVAFGENTHNEMCFDFLAYYPRVDLAQWHWLLPAATATCELTTK
ncbi:MAG: peptidylglycine alpha-amidating monooxygenase, partial [Myxococcales bacterium]|nr:peptidylglycine alpha-amidating monooxygenase [Myxococcales bacterium]